MTTSLLHPGVGVLMGAQTAPGVHWVGDVLVGVDLYWGGRFVTTAVLIRATGTYRAG